MYKWEHGKQGRKLKETGTVIFNPREDQPCEFETFASKMSDETLKSLQETMKFTKLLLPQAQCFNGIYKSRDVILHSRTGSGKTLGYALPLIERRLKVEVGEEGAPRDSPFLLIFVFSTELAVQTQSVLQTIYGDRLKVKVPALEPVVAGEHVDVLVGTIANLDLAIRGSDAVGKKRKDGDESDSDDDDDDDEDGADTASEDDSDDEDDTAAEGGKKKLNLTNATAAAAAADKLPTISAKTVRAIVIDEVDTTLGPKYSRLGRRMKFLLKFIRKANGSRAEGLNGQDFRAHHYVLVGATIPNWVIKAGFLGVKKYYYRFVAAGASKLPSQLECYCTPVPNNKRTESLISLLSNRKTVERTVIFTSRNAIDGLEKQLNTAIHTAASPSSSLKNLVVRSLSPLKSETDRIQCMQQFNDCVANVLLCTDFAARGLDFVKVELVVMLTLPQHNMAAETFVHRAGRTARVDRNGKCITFYDATKKEEVAAIKAVETVTHIQFRPLQLDSNMNSASSGGSAASGAPKATFELKVRNSFQFAAGQGLSKGSTAPSPSEVLRQALGVDDFKKVTQTETQPDTPSTIKFCVPMAMYEGVKKKLWKYDLKDLTEAAIPTMGSIGAGGAKKAAGAAPVATTTTTAAARGRVSTAGSSAATPKRPTSGGGAATAGSSTRGKRTRSSV